MTDLLLEWLSYRGKARRADVPPSLLDGARADRKLEAMAMLGHVEMDRSGKWAVCPPVLAGLPANIAAKPAAIVCGARTPALLQNLQAACAARQAELEAEVQDGLPTRIAIYAEDPLVLKQVATDTGIYFQRDAAFSILACLPSVATWPRRPCPMPFGRLGEVRRFSRRRCDWVDSTIEEATSACKGLFRIRRDRGSITLLKEAPHEQSEIDAYAGRLSVAVGLKKLRWNAINCAMRIPFLLRPPLVICRALVLCNGRAPSNDWRARETVFEQVPTRIANLTAALTGLRFA